MTDLSKAIADLEEERRVMLRCADLNRRETGDSYYMQRAIRCDQEINALRRVAARAHEQQRDT